MGGGSLKTICLTVTLYKFQKCKGGEAPPPVTRSTIHFLFSDVTSGYYGNCQSSRITFETFQNGVFVVGLLPKHSPSPSAGPVLT